MAITPTVMIAAQGMLGGGGVGVSSAMTASMSGATSDPITAGIQELNSLVATLIENGDTVNAAALTAVLSTMPTAYTTVTSTVSSATAQAAAMVPNIKSFINIHSSSTAFGSASAEYGAALAQFGNKSFGDLGIGVKSFTDANSGGLTSLVPGLAALANKAKTDAFGSLGKNLDPTALAQGQADIASASLRDGLQSVGQGIKNFGTLFDFSKPQTMTYRGLVESLQKQGLADSTGINDGISTAGYDPKDLGSVPDSVFKDVLSGVQGADLAKIISQCGVTKAGTYESAADLVDPTKVMPPGATAALGIKPGAGIDGLKSLANTMTNIGVPLDGASAAKLLGGVQTKVGSYLSSLTELVPTSVSAALSPFLGTGSSPFGTPSMSDMMGSVSGKHTADFNAAGKQLSDVSTSAPGKTLLVQINSTIAAINANTDVATSIAALQTAVTTFNTAVSTNLSLSGVFTKVTDYMTNITSHISLETSNLSLAGLNLGSLPTVLPGSGQILAFASKLHSFGVDKLQLGQNNIFNGVASNDLTGDAIKAALLEGKNVAAMAGAGKAPTSVSNQTKALAEANTNNIDSLIDAFKLAKTEQTKAKATLDQATPETVADATSSYARANDAATSAQNDLQSAANSAGGAALEKANAAIAQYAA